MVKIEKIKNDKKMFKNKLKTIKILREKKVKIINSK